ncbi:TRAFAC clade GTPase domain-containing protein [Actinoplanes sp. G11-F43]|uniref:TRAFAC clade GTPase domain-containing protein n=1 Tax=Actinoplanes sp. G11-F43 TaxID=3424130 RepID=UPI003D34BC3D
MATTLYCPYCYDRFAERKIEFRCAGRVSVTGKVCKPKVDRNARDVMGDGQLRFPAFEADGRKLNATCPHCDLVTFIRLCPNCHSALPNYFGKVDSRMIALIGAKESGKTIFITVLLHEMMHRISRQFGVAVLGADDDTRLRYEKDYESSLYEQGSLPDVTRSASAGRLRQPLVFSFAIDRRRLGRTRVDRSVLSFFDTAGEDLTHSDSVELNTRYLASADGIILLLDPLQMRGARPLVGDDTELPVRADAGDRPEHVLGRVVGLLERMSGASRRGKIKKPIAVAFSKMDTLLGTLPEDSPILAEPPGDACFDEADSLAVHRHVEQLLHKWQGGGLSETLGVHFEKYRLFGLSALGNNPVGGAGDDGPRRVSHHGIQPIRVADPFLWLMSEFGAIPKKRG